jgi:hypothetical protein
MSVCLWMPRVCVRARAQAEYHIASVLLDILSNAAQSHITVARSDVPGCAYELHPFPDAALKATQTIGRMFRSTFTQLPTKRSIRLYRLLLASASNNDVHVRLSAIRTLRSLRADSKYACSVLLSRLCTSECLMTFPLPSLCRRRYQLRIVRPGRSMLTSPVLFTARAHTPKTAEWIPIYELIDVLSLRLRRCCHAVMLSCCHAVMLSCCHAVMMSVVCLCVSLQGAECSSIQHVRRSTCGSGDQSPRPRRRA